MIPNRFPGLGLPPEYNTADAALLFIESGRADLDGEPRATRASRRRTPSSAAVLPSVDAILDAHREPGPGTASGSIPADGLLDPGARRVCS